jgi:hypothetical protein
MRKSHLFGLATLAGSALLSSSAFGAALTVPLTTTNAGTETVSLAPNGDFEGGRGYLNCFPDNWTVRSGDSWVSNSSAAPVTTFASDSNSVVVWPAESNLQYIGYSAGSISLTANTEYVLSAYLWYGMTGGKISLDLTDAQFDDGTGRVSVTPSTPGATTGVFTYQYFNTATTGTNVIPRVLIEGANGLGSFGAVVDNIAITPAADFVAPSSVPEPVTGSLAACGALFILGRRRA